MLEVSNEDVARLNDRQLTDLLRRLLHLEAAKYGLRSSGIDVSLRITVADGGEDGRILWTEQIDRTNYLPKRLVSFQSKAVQRFSDTQTASELVENGQIKARVHDALASNGAYIIFASLPLTSQAIGNRILAMRKALADANATYAAQAELHFYDGNKIRDWINEYPAAVLFVLGAVGKQALQGAKTWDEWSTLPQMHQYRYEANDALRNHIEQIRAAVALDKSVLRILGPSTVGKTRLVFEAFRPDADVRDVAAPSPSFQVIYVDAEGSDSLQQQLSDAQRNTPYGILVVDNCPLALHKKIAAEVKRIGSRLSLVSIDLASDETFNDDPVLRLGKLDDNTIVALLRQAYSNVPEDELRRLASFAQGFPDFAVRLMRARLEGHTDFGRINDDEIVNRLLWGRTAPDAAREQAIVVLSIFEQLGCEGSVESELEHVARQLCAMEPAAFYGHMHHFQQTEIVERRGHFLRIRLPPLAVELALRWWRRTRPVDAKRIIDSLPDGLAEAMCERMTMLDWVEQAKELVSDICGDRAPFGQAEVLNTERGSKLFRALVEVNPEATAHAITHAFRAHSRNDLLNVGPGRRSLIFALEKLAFRKATFTSAALLLLKFAAAENEKWANNATGIFLRLFHTRLSGTEAAPDERLAIIDAALKSKEEAEQALGVEALKHVLETTNFMRAASADRQGSNTVLKEWAPKYWREIFDYWKEALLRLSAIMRDKPALADKARSIIAGRIGALIVSDEMIEPIEKVIRTIFHDTGGYWPEAYASIGRALRLRGNKLPDQARAKLEEWHELLGPKALDHVSKLKMIVGTPDWAAIREEKTGAITDISERAATDLARECAQQLDDWLPHLGVVFHGEQRQGYAFGFQLGKASTEPERIVDLAMQELIADEKNSNPSALGGCLRAIEATHPKLVARVLSAAYEHPSLHRHLVRLASAVKMTDLELSRVADLVGMHRIPARQARLLSYGQAMKHLPPESVVSFITRIAEANNDGLWSALEVAFMYLLGSPEQAKALEHVVRKLIVHPQLELKDGIADSDMYHWQELTKRILANKDASKEASFIAEKFVAACEDGTSRYDLSDEVLSALLSNHLDSVWPVFEATLLGQEIGGYNLAHFLGVGYDDKANGSLLINLVPPGFLETWVGNNPKAANVLAEMVPIYEAKSEKTWHPLAKFLIDHYGENEAVLQNLQSNLGSFGWVGSVTDYYRPQLDLFQSLVEHPIANVRIWAAQRLAYLRAAISEAEKLDQDRSMGIYRR